MNQKQKVYIVAGGASGIGAASVALLRARENRVHVLDIQTQDGGRFYHTCDVSNWNDVCSAVEEIMDIEGQIDGLFHIAGIHVIGNALENSDREIAQIFKVNVGGCINLIKAVVPIMKGQGKGVIILPGSDQCFVAKTDSCYYGMSKMAIAYLTKSLALDFAHYGIRVNCICPGPVDTPMYGKSVDYIQAHYKEYQDRNYLWETLSHRQPVGRIAKPEEIAGLVAFLLSDEAAYITGALIPIDGGSTIGTL